MTYFHGERTNFSPSLKKDPDMLTSELVMENSVQGKFEEAEEWIEQLKKGGSLSCTDAGESTSGWSSLPGDFFTLRGPHYLADKVKIPGGDCLLKLLAFDWLKSGSRIDNILENPNHRVTTAPGRANTLGKGDPFIWAFNLQVNISFFVRYSKISRTRFINRVKFTFNT